jgi:hypothetical protein
MATFWTGTTTASVATPPTVRAQNTQHMQTHAPGDPCSVRWLRYLHLGPGASLTRAWAERVSVVPARTHLRRGSLSSDHMDPQTPLSSRRKLRPCTYPSVSWDSNTSSPHVPSITPQPDCPHCQVTHSHLADGQHAYGCRDHCGQCRPPSRGAECAGLVVVSTSPDEGQGASELERFGLFGRRH